MEFQRKVRKGHRDFFTTGTRGIGKKFFRGIHIMDVPGKQQWLIEPVMNLL